MAKKKNTIPSGFEDILGNIYGNAEEQGGVTDMNTLDSSVEIPLEDNNDDEPPVNVNPEDGNKADQTDDPNAHDDDSAEPDPAQVNNPEPAKNEPPVEDPNNNDDDPTDADLIEAQQVGLLFDAIGDKLGWNMDEIDEKDRPLNTEALANYFADVVKENSVPEYADERIQALDEYVKQGGKFEDFYAKQQEVLTIDNIDLEDENNQKAVVREFMKYSGYTDEQINKKISRYEDSDVLYDEAEDALDRLKDIRQKEVEEATRRQEELAKEQQKQSREFFESVSKGINELKDVRGISVPKEDRKALFDYIFKVDQNGLSQYQKDFNKNISKNLIESAYFTMKADSLISTAKRDGESSATEKLRNLLRHTSKNHSTYNADDKQKSVTDLVSGMF